MDKKNPLEPENLEISLGDFGYNTAKGILGTFPIVGSLLVEFFGLAKDSPYETRKKKFIIALAEKLEFLASKSRIDITDLKNNEEFQDILIQSYEIAIKNSQKEKLELLQNAVLNTALKIDVQRDEKIVFLDVLNRITPSHYRALKLWYTPESWLSDIIHKNYNLEVKGKTMDMVTWPSVLNDVLKYEPSFFGPIIQDLATWNLINNRSSQHTVDELPNVLVERMSQNFKVWQNDFGKKFLQFIDQPIIEFDTEKST